MSADIPSYRKNHFFGRGAEQDRLERAISGSEAVVVYGLAGIGKSALVGAAVESAALDSHCLDCDEWNGVGKILEGLARSLGTDVPRDPNVLKSEILIRLRRDNARKVIVFDNLETIWARERPATQNLLGELAAVEKVSVVAALRAGEVPGALSGWIAIQVRRLGREAAVELFCDSAGERFDGDGDIPQLVDEDLEGVPLAITLLGSAAAGDEGPASIAELRQRLREVLLKIPLNAGPDRHRSLVASLQISTELLDHGAGRLLALLGVLPAGIARDDLIALETSLPGMGDLRPDAQKLSGLGLAFSSDRDRLETLKPIRDYIEQSLWPSPEDLAAASAHYLSLVPSEGEAKEHNPRTAQESANIASMAATLPDRIEQCRLLIRQGDAELKAGEFAVALSTLRAAGNIARAARDPKLLAYAALGISGGIGGSGHSFDRADEERLAVLREANNLLTDDDAVLKLELVIRLMAELHFDASYEAMKEREELAAAADELQTQVDDPAVRLQLTLRKLKGAAPTDSLEDRLDAARDVMAQAAIQHDAGAEIEAGHLLVSFLMENGQSSTAAQERQRIATRIEAVEDQDRRHRFEWQDRVMARAQWMFAGDFVNTREDLGPEPQTEDVTNSVYRRWLHQRVLLALDHDGEDFVRKVQDLTDRLKEGECEKFRLASDDQLGRLAYEWWPTWRSTLALALAARGEPDDRESAHGLIHDLARQERGALFGRILKHEYYVQVLALVALALQRLCLLANTEDDATELKWRDTRIQWARALDDLLEPFDSRAVVPGSCVMNLGAVVAFRAMLKACAGEWFVLDRDDLFERAANRNTEFGSPPATARTLIAEAEMRMLDQRAAEGRERAQVAATKGLELARRYEMRPWEDRATSVLRLAATA